MLYPSGLMSTLSIRGSDPFVLACNAQTHYAECTLLQVMLVIMSRIQDGVA